MVHAIRQTSEWQRTALLLLLSIAPTGWAQNSAQLEFFESKVRPVLVTRCGTCHGEKVQMGGIQLTSKQGVERSSSVVPGNVESSRLIQALRHTGKIKMPPTGKLAAHEIAAIEQWVAQGALWPEATASSRAAETVGHWAFKPVKKVVAPAVKTENWVRSDIDRFVLSKLEERDLSPAPDADKYTLLRRLTLDLTGLLPTVEEIEAFQKDSSEGALERVVDRLLASPGYGDRWGRHWLDVTYWADTTGVGRRIPLRNAWRYRDYVINSFNDDKPFTRFIREQIAGETDPPKAGDEGAKPQKDVVDEHAAATGFLVLGPWAWFSYDRAQLRLDVADLQVDLVGRTFLGLTLGCARCHDHKFDPIPNKDYYGMVGIFLSTKTLASNNGDGGINTVQLPQSLADIRSYADQLESWEKKVAEVEKVAAEIKAEQSELNKSIETWKAQPSDEETQARIQQAKERLAVLSKKAGSAPDRQVAPFTRYMKPRLAEVYAAEDMEFPDDARIAVRGDAHQLGQPAPRGFLSAVAYGPQVEIPPHTSGRKELAAWLSDAGNPLPARVYVNRIWHHLFGRGIVATTDNFGSRGELPSHPELLDYLATRFIANGWSTKKTIKEIVLSHTYQLASGGEDSKALEVDPENKLLWRANRRRLEVEAIRDTILQASGRLDPARSGASLPLTAENVHTIAPFFLEEDSIIDDHVRYRRTVYQPIMRSGQMTDVDILNLFDFADPDQVVGVRTQTMVPTQALYLMNSSFIKEQARSLAAKLLSEPLLDQESRVARVILETLNRPATDRDKQQARQFLSDFRAGLNKARENDEALKAWARFCHAIFVSSEFLYRR